MFTNKFLVGVSTDICAKISAGRESNAEYHVLFLNLVSGDINVYFVLLYL